jgi:hypothetical protein
VSDALDHAFAAGAVHQNFVSDYLTHLKVLCDKYGFDFAFAAAQADNESDSYTSEIFSTYRNTVGLGVTNSQNLSLRYESGKDMARAHIVHLWAYTRGRIPAGHELEKYIPLDPRYEAVFAAKDAVKGEPMADSVSTIGDWNTNGRWALLTEPPLYGTRILSRMREIFGDIPQGEVTPMDGNEYGRVPMPAYVDMLVSKPSHTGSGYGYDYSPVLRKNVGVVHHETQGHGSGRFYQEFFSCPSGERCKNALVDFFIDKAGIIFRLNDPGGHRGGWANGGGVGEPGGLEGDGVAFYARFGSAGVNFKLVSIEYEKLDTDNYTEPQVASGGALAAWVHDQDRQPWEPHPYVPKYDCVTSLLHYELGTTNCGKGEMDDIARVQAVTKGTMKRYQSAGDGLPVPPEVPPQPPILLPGGITEKEASDRFGKARRFKDGKWSGRVHGFDPKGPVSLAWAKRAAEENVWPEIDNWWVVPDGEDTRQIITFRNAWALVKMGDRGSWRWMDLQDE